ncbi:MAG TPA: CapA family protein [Candidatus Polarisedimenticolia bacterium]|nr:CapA family protein [Candidatus Polarisedimenticolia bacterium]
MRTPCRGMVRNAVSGSFDFTSRLRRSVPLRMTAASGFTRAICCCVMLALPGTLRALQSPQDLKPATSSATPVQPTSTPMPQPSPSSALPLSTTDSSVHPPSSYDEIVVTAVGDVMLGTTFPDESTLPPNDGADLLTEVAPFLKRGDVVYGNLEGPIVDGGDSTKCRGKKIGTCFAFRVPTRYGKYLKDAGFTAMGLANNHAMDFGLEGRASSRQVLDAMQIAHTGEVGDIVRLMVKGRKITVIAFATYQGAFNFLDLDASLQTIRTAKTESDLVIVGFHGGAEGATHQHVLEGDETFLGEDRGDLRRFTHAAIDAGADLVLGSGPHVVRAMEIYKGKLIAYSLGNFATYGPFNLNAENGLTLVLEAHLAADGTFLRGKAYAVKQDKPGGPKLDPEMKILPVLRALSDADFKQTAIVVGTQGELWLPGTDFPPCSDAPDLLEQRFGGRVCGIFP